MGAKLRIFMAINVAFFGYLIYKAMEIPDAKIEGWVAEGFEDIRTAYREIFTMKLEKGSTFSAYHNGKMVAHLWAGCKNFFCTEKWQADTTSLIHSSTKFLGALCLAIMADRDHLDYSARVSKYWPEFGVNGKEDVTVEQLLSHTAGVVGVEPPLSIEDLVNDAPIVAKRLAEQKPAWKPGTETHYHALTIGMYVNELFKRVHPERRSCVDFLERDIFEPLNLDIKIGLKDPDQIARYAEAHGLSHLRLMMRPILRGEKSTQLAYKRFFIFPNGTYNKIMSPIAGTYLGHDFFRRSYLRIPLLSTNGIATSRSLAQLMGIVALGGRKSSSKIPFPQTLIKSRNIMEKLQEPLSTIKWMSLLEDAWLSRGPIVIKSPSGSKMIGFAGMGGQMAFADPEKGVGFSYLTNHMSPYNAGDDPRHIHLQKALFRSLERL